MHRKHSICTIFFVFLFFPLTAQSKFNLKATVLSYITGSGKITAEIQTTERQSLELTGGIIGIGGDAKNNNPEGWTVRTCYKFILPQLGPWSWNEQNPLAGFYAKGELIYTDFTYNENSGVRNQCKRFAALACFGGQYIKDWFLFDFYVGAGAAFGDNCPTNYYHGFMGLKPGDNIALTFGLKFGIAF